VQSTARKAAPQLTRALYLKMKKDKEQIIQAESEDGQLAGEAIVEVVGNQLKDNNPPETKEALKRLIKSGETRENA